jgi:hypothetical protein
MAPASASPPLVTPDAARLKLDEVGLYDVGYRYRGQGERLMPLGWSGPFEDRTGVACMPAGVQGGKQAFLLHCPWRGGTGYAFQEFALKLPPSRRIVLTGATAMRADSVGKSDGVAFRILVNGRKVVDELRGDAVWKPFTVDLTAMAGKAVRLRFETDPGPRNDAGFDFALWGDRTLAIEGFHAPPVAHAAPPAVDLRALWSHRAADAAPPASGAGTRTVRTSGKMATLQFAGGRERLVYSWRAPESPEDQALGTLTLHGRLQGDAAFAVPLARSASLIWAKDASPVGPGTMRVSEGRAVMTRAYRVAGEVVTLNAVGRLEGKSLVLDISADKPGVASLDAGMWGPVQRRRAVTAPYYSGQVYYLPREGLFANAYLDWTNSNASAHDGTRARYDARTDGARAPLKERVVYAAAWNLAEVFPNVPNPPSPYRAEMGGRLVLDTWGGRYSDIARNLDRLAEYGIRDGYLIIHDWQRSGYDNALPAHVPAAADKGGDEGMKALVGTAERLGYRVALHENYVDYYPNYDRFDGNDIALDANGESQRAWFNPGTGIQSFAVKPTAILRLAATQSPEIRRRYGSNANYLDVHSAVPPWFHVDDRASEAGAAMFNTVWRAHRDLWAYERKTFGGPVTGEGYNHWYWSGLLDGVEAQFGAGWEANQGMAAPLMVDFDLLRIHPLQLNHGMGYYERWWGKPSWSGLPPIAVLDQYRMQEIAYGHAAFLAGSTWNNLPYAWLEHHLVTPVAKRYATSSPVGIQYRVGGKWVHSTAAAKAGTWDCVRVRYANGLTVTANNAAASLPVSGVALPRFGWHASGAGVTAYTAVRGGALVDYAETATSVFANARNGRDWSFTGIRRVRPEVASFEPTGPRTFRVTYRWRVGERLNEDFMCFVHFTPAGATDPNVETISFQGDHALARPASTWKEGSVVLDGPHTVAIPESIADGDFTCAIGLYGVGGGARVSLEGVDDGRTRIVLGVVHIRDAGRTVTWSPETGRGEARKALYAKDVNPGGPIVDFGSVRTNGSVLVERNGPDWVLRVWPREAVRRVELSAARFGIPSAVRAGTASIPAVRRGGLWTFPLNGSPEYRWKAK